MPSAATPTPAYSHSMERNTRTRRISAGITALMTADATTIRNCRTEESKSMRVRMIKLMVSSMHTLLVSNLELRLYTSA